MPAELKSRQGQQLAILRFEPTVIILTLLVLIDAHGNCFWKKMATTIARASRWRQQCIGQD
jgi:hypothetical protein